MYLFFKVPAFLEILFHFPVYQSTVRTNFFQESEKVINNVFLFAVAGVSTHRTLGTVPDSIPGLLYITIHFTISPCEERVYFAPDLPPYSLFFQRTCLPAPCSQHTVEDSQDKEAYAKGVQDCRDGRYQNRDKGRFIKHGNIGIWVFNDLISIGSIFSP